MTHTHTPTILGTPSHHEGRETVYKGVRLGNNIANPMESLSPILQEMGAKSNPENGRFVIQFATLDVLAIHYHINPPISQL